MDKATKEECKKMFNEVKQQSRKLDLLLAESERQAKRIKKLQDSRSSTKKENSSKSLKM